MKHSHYNQDAYSSSPANRKKKTPWFLLISILIVTGALLFCTMKLNALVNERMENREERESSIRKDKEITAPKAEAPTPEAEAPATEAPAEAAPAAADEITLWTYPIGLWGDQAYVAAMTAQFEAETGIRVNVEYLTYVDGDDKINTALAAGAAPDLILEGPERLSAIWGAQGHMVDLSGLYDSEDRKEIYASVQSACFNKDGSSYIYPMAMSVFTMAINKTVFEAAGAMQYIDEENHTWTTEDFVNAVKAVYAYTGKPVGTIFCGGQGGDQGTRTLVTNLYGGSFTDSDHTRYTWNEPANLLALELLCSMAEALPFDDNIVGGDEIALFYQGDLNMAFCWNYYQQVNPNSAGKSAGKTASGDEILCMAFPSPAGYDTKLWGTVWGFGIFDNGDPARIEAAKQFIRYMCDSQATVDAVQASGYFPVRRNVEGTDLWNLWAKDSVQAEYQQMIPLMGDYYQLTPNWSNARMQWWKMLRAVGDTDGSYEAISAEVERFVAQVN